MSATASPTPVRLTVDHQHAPIGVASWFTDQAVVPLRKEGNSYRASVQEVTAAIGQPPLPLGETAFAWTRGSGGKYIMTGKRPRDTEASFKAVCHKE